MRLASRLAAVAAQYDPSRLAAVAALYDPSLLTRLRAWR